MEVLGFVWLVAGIFVAAGVVVGGVGGFGSSTGSRVGDALRRVMTWLQRSGGRRSRGVDLEGLIVTRHEPSSGDMQGRERPEVGRLEEPQNGYAYGERESFRPDDEQKSPATDDDAARTNSSSSDEAMARIRAGRTSRERGELESLNQPAAFALRLDGEGWQGNALRRGRTARLSFGDAIAASETFLRFHGAKFAAEISRPEAELTLLLRADAGIAVRSRVGLAQFREGRLCDAVHFDLDVAADAPERVALSLQFFGATTLLYSVPFALPIADLHAADLPSLRLPELDLDATDAQLADKALGPQLLLSLSLRQDRLELTLTEYHEGVASVTLAATTTLTAPGLQTLLDRVQAELGPDYFAAASWDSADPQPAHLQACVARAASAGSLLHRELAKAGAELLLARIDEKPDGTRLTVASADVLLPLELLYPYEYSPRWPQSQREAHPPRADRFWGARLALEVLHGDGRGIELKRRHRRAQPRVSLNIGPDIRNADVLRIHEDLRTSLQQAGVATAQSADCDAMREVLLLARSDAAVIYVYCHGSGAQPQRGAVEALQLDFDCEINPDAVVGDRRYPHAPVLILNACHSGQTSPLLFTNFLSAFRGQDALGIIATSFYVPQVFGAKFGAELVQACLERSLPLAENVRRLRQRYARAGNPAPLFYSVQCQLDP